MSGKLGPCGRCFSPTAAVTVERVAFGNSTYEIPLCNPHADAFRREMFAWTRCGRLEEEETFFRRREVADGESRGRVVASYVHIPVSRPREQPPEPEPPKTPQLSRPTVPPGAHAWTFSDHALDRQDERGVSTEEALWCAVAPDSVRPGKRQPGTMVHIRGRVRIVVNPVMKRIITVYDASAMNTEEQELEHAAS